MATNHLLESYKQVSAKLKKKRFPMRKPNLAEAVDQFLQIMNSFKREGSYHYAVFCCLAVARCEQAMNAGSSQEAGYYVDAGDTLWELSTEEDSTGYTGFEEDITEAINCYLLAIRIYSTQQRLGMAAQLYAEIGHILSVIGRHTQAAEYITQAAVLRQKEAPLNAASLWLDATHNYVLAGTDYRSATECLNSVIKVLVDSDIASPASLPHYTGVTTATFMQQQAATQLGMSGSVQHLTTPSLASPVRPCLLAEARISLILLFLLQDAFLSAKDHIDKLVLDNPLGPDASDEVVSLLQTLVELSISPSTTNPKKETTASLCIGFCLLESAQIAFSNIVTFLQKACERRQLAGLRALQRELWHTLNQTQNELLQRLVCAYDILI